MTDRSSTALYLRASLDATGEELSVTRQEEDGVKYIAARGWVVGGVFVDNDTSAAGKVARPEFERMLTEHQEGRFGIIVARDMDRLTRNRPDRLRLLDIGERTRLMLAFWRGTDLDLSTPAGRLTAEILASVARHEIEQMSDRRKRANIQKAEMGLPGGGRRPFGYTLDQRSIVPGEADVLLRAAETVISDPGGGLWAATGLLRDSGFTTTAGGTWHHSELRRLLLNPRYTGRRMHRGVDVGPAVWPAIFDDDTAAAVRAVLSSPSRRRVGAPTRYLLSGLARCGLPGCEQPIHGSPTSAGYPVYLCATRRHVSIRMAEVDRFVIDLLAGRMAQPDGLAVLAAPAGGGPSLSDLRRREHDLTARAGGLAEAFAAGDIDRAQLQAGTRRVRAELEEVRAVMTQTVQVSEVRDLVASPDAAGMVRRWAADEPARFRAVLARVAEVSLVSPGRGARSFRPRSVQVRWL